MSGDLRKQIREKGVAGGLVSYLGGSSAAPDAEDEEAEKEKKAKQKKKKQQGPPLDPNAVSAFTSGFRSVK